MFIWPLILTDYLDLDMFKICSFNKIHMHNEYLVSISTGSKVVAVTPIWPLALKNNLDLLMLPLKTCGFMRYTCTLNINCLSLCDQKLWPWPLGVTLTLTCHTQKCVALWDSHTCQILSLYPFWFKSYGYLTFDLEGWPWPWYVMFKLCSFKKYTCIMNI